MDSTIHSVDSFGSPGIPMASSNSQNDIPLPQSGQSNKPPHPPSKRKSEGSGKQQSAVWDHFDKIVGVDGKRRAKCKYCGKEYMAESRIHGTSNLRNHTITCPKFPNRDGNGQQILNFKPKDSEEGFDVAATSFTLEMVIYWLLSPVTSVLNQAL